MYEATFALIAFTAWQSLKLVTKVGISATNHSNSSNCKPESISSTVPIIPSIAYLSVPGQTCHLIRHEALIHCSSIPKPTLHHLHAQQIAELDLGDVVGDVFLLPVSKGVSR